MSYEIVSIDRPYDHTTVVWVQPKKEQKMSKPWDSLRDATTPMQPGTWKTNGLTRVNLVEVGTGWRNDCVKISFDEDKPREFRNTSVRQLAEFFGALATQMGA